jgi:hypothetical protein
VVRCQLALDDRGRWEGKIGRKGERLTFVGFADDPSRRVTDSEVQDLAILNHMVQALHQLWDAGREVPPVHVE